MSIEKFIKAVENENFVEAHELLEHEWKDYKKSGKKLEAKAIQGLINGATALALFRKGRVEAYEKIWKVFEKYKSLISEVELENSSKYMEAKELLEIKKSLITN